MKNLRFVEVRSEIGAGTRGASLGIDALKVASLNLGIDYFARYPKTDVPDENMVLFRPNRHPNAIHVEAIEANLNRVCEAVKATVAADEFPIVLAADHSSAYGTLAGLKAAFPDRRIGAIWVDAHADLHSPYTTPSGNMHGMPLAMATASDHADRATNQPLAETLTVWERIKAIGGVQPKVLPQDIVYIAVRSTEQAETAFTTRHGIRNFTVADVNRLGAERVAQEALDLLADCDLVYVSFDVDSMDPHFSEGTGTPVQNGIAPGQAEILNASLVAAPKVVCWEVVEINPALDSSNQMARHATRTLGAVMQRLEERLAADQNRQPVSPAAVHAAA